jgi:2TM domain
MNDAIPTRPATSTAAPDASTLDSASREEAYRRARRRVRMLRGWYLHALVYACVIAGLWAMYAFSGHAARFVWPLPPTLGWGLGLAIHGLVVWLGTSRKGRQWESRKIEQYLHEEMGSRGSLPK